MKKIFTACFLFLCFFVLSNLASAMQLQEIHPTSFHSNGAKIAGWHWLRRANDFATWTFTMPQSFGNSGVVVLCFSTLSTNTFNGGAGYDSSLKVSVGRSRVVNLKLKNDCPCLKNRRGGDSHGIGYSSHGCLKRKISRSQFGGSDKTIPAHGKGRSKPKPNNALNNNILTVKVEFPKRGRHHTAVRQDSLKLIWMKR